MTDPCEFEIPDELPTAIGRFIIVCGYVENDIGFQLLRMLKPSIGLAFHAHPLIGGMDFKVKLANIRNMASRNGEQEKDYIVECCDNLRSLYDKRNKISHSLVHGQTERGFFKFTDTRTNPKTGRINKPFNISVEMIHSWTRETIQWCHELDISLSELGYPHFEEPQGDTEGPEYQFRKYNSPDSSLVPRPNRKIQKPL